MCKSPLQLRLRFLALIVAVHFTRVRFANLSRLELSTRTVNGTRAIKTRLPGRAHVAGTEPANGESQKIRLRMSSTVTRAQHNVLKNESEKLDPPLPVATLLLTGLLTWRRCRIRLAHRRGYAGLARVLLQVVHFLLRVVERLLLLGYFLLIICILFVPLGLIA